MKIKIIFAVSNENQNNFQLLYISNYIGNLEHNS